MTETDNQSEYDDMQPGLLSRGRLGIAVAAVIFLLIVIVGELTPLGQLLNPLTEKLRIHVLSTPNLDKLKTQQTVLDVSDRVQQIPNSNVLRVDNRTGQHHYFVINDKWDLREIAPNASGDMPPEGVTAVPYITFQEASDHVDLLKFDVVTGPLTGFTVGARTDFDFEKNPPLIINYGNSAVLYRRGKTHVPIPDLAYVPDFNQKVAIVVPEISDIEKVAADRFGKQFFAITSDADTDELRLVGVNFDAPKPLVVTFDTPVNKDTQLFHCGPAATLVLIDQEKLRIVSARDGKAIATHYHKDFLHNLNGKNSPFKSWEEELPPFQIVPGVPAAIFADKLIDLRDGELADTLYDFGPKSVIAVDFNNKKLYYSTFDQGGRKMDSYMSINVFDLHEVVFQYQITLGTRNLVEDDALEREDNIEQMFLGQFNQLVALSAPAKK